MATGVEELLDMLYELIDEAKSVPLASDKCIIERDKALDLLDDIKAQFPMELAEAKKLIAARTDYIASNDYCEDALRRTEEAIGEAYEELKASRNKFRAASAASGAPQRPSFDVAVEND